jgi:hypothetical protein
MAGNWKNSGIAPQHQKIRNKNVKCVALSILFLITQPNDSLLYVI